MGFNVINPTGPPDSGLVYPGLSLGRAAGKHDEVPSATSGFPEGTGFDGKTGMGTTKYSHPVLDSLSKPSEPAQTAPLSSASFVFPFAEHSVSYGAKAPTPLPGNTEGTNFHFVQGSPSEELPAPPGIPGKSPTDSHVGGQSRPVATIP